jgi:hypothetical protein
MHSIAVGDVLHLFRENKCGTDEFFRGREALEPGRKYRWRLGLEKSRVPLAGNAASSARLARL